MFRVNSFRREEPKGRRDFGVQFYLANFSVRLKKGTPSAINNMPIKWVLHWLPNVGTPINSQILTEVSQCVGSFNGIKEGAWKATLTFYKPILKEQADASEFPRDLLGISLQEQPNKHYMVIRGQRLIMEAESSIQMIMERLQSYKTKGALNFEPLDLVMCIFYIMPSVSSRNFQTYPTQHTFNLYSATSPYNCTSRPTNPCSHGKTLAKLTSHLTRLWEESLDFSIGTDVLYHQNVSLRGLTIPYTKPPAHLGHPTLALGHASIELPNLYGYLGHSFDIPRQALEVPP
ncbi:hypothetical protein HAX54_011129 [Datura stramonium]|uniref:Mediator of RNA polymerase II transcription subunit 20 n=1 Tax=Datura stramonium TaxID=4076 RepID=A0ABS8RX02_DATST|nr:hypothetical protein [Datura stramonium]